MSYFLKIVFKACDFISRNRIFNLIGDLIPVSDKTNVKVRMYSNVRQEEYRRFLRFSGKQEKLKDFLLTSRINSI